MCLLQACIHHGADADETCVDCLKSKANIGRPKGLRDDLVFLLEEDLSHINLCSLHCKMHNTEQLLGSLGLSAYRVGCLHLLNAALSSYGAESQQDFSCIKVKEKPGQQTGIERANIKVASFSGGTERQILKNIDNIVNTGLPLDKVSGYYQDSEGGGREEVMEYLVSFQQQKEGHLSN